MKTLIFTCIILLNMVAETFGQELDENLKLLEPFINIDWEAKEPRFGEEARIERKFEIIKASKSLMLLLSISIIGILKSRK